MLNNDIRKEAVKGFESAVRRQKRLANEVTNLAEELMELRSKSAKAAIIRVENYINLLANSPKEFEKSISEYKAEYKSFNSDLSKLAENSGSVELSSKKGAGAAVGAAAAGAVAPTALMAIATTFGTASTGAAISSLSGAAAANAAAAWLGGGALAAGGGGMAVGKGIMAAAGPVGLAVGGFIVAGTVFHSRKKNTEIAKEANHQRKKVETQIAFLKVAKIKVSELIGLTNEHKNGVLRSLRWLKKNSPTNYRDFDTNEKDRLAALINHINSLSELLRKRVEP